MLHCTMEYPVARWFLYLIVALFLMVLASALAFRFFGAQMMRFAMVPAVGFEAQPARQPLDYARADMWLARPDKPGNPALWTPPGQRPAARPRAALFFIHPTSYLDRARWNAPLNDTVANERAALFLRGQASAFNDSAAIWAPRYRQATFGAFLTSTDAANKAIDLAYRDVSAAFEEFLNEVGPDRPIFLAAHSQGSLHLARLLHERIAGTPIARRIVAAYVVGWPVSRTADLPAMGLPECREAAQTGCILSWQSFAEPADPSLILDTFDATAGFTGAARRGTELICTNPLTGTPGSEAPASANLGTLFPSPDLKSATLQGGRIPARCQGRGFLMIGQPPADFSRFVLTGNNYHVFDYSLFWANVRADAARRLAALGGR